MSFVHDTGLTEVYSGSRVKGEAPKANIVFIHGLNGHPLETWSVKSKSTSSEPDDRRPSDSSASSVRKGSMFSKFAKRNKSGLPLERTLSNAPSTFSTDTTSESVSPREIIVDPFTSEPEALCGSPMSNNQTPGKKVFWPRDLLPQDFPNTRVYTFGYDAKLLKPVKPMGNSTVSTIGTKTKLSFTDHAHDLMVTLNKELDDHTPIILCAHSLGGVLVKRALWTSHIDDRPDFKKLARLTKVVVFFGTPHHGSNKANLAEIATQITSMAGRDSRPHLATSLRLDSEILEIIHTEFLRLLRVGQFYIHNFTEGRSMGPGIGKIVEDYSSKIHDSRGMEIHEVIDGDHRNMNRYSSAQDAGYRKVASALRYYMKKLDKKFDIERMSIASNLSKDVPTKTYFCVPHEKNKRFIGRADDIGAINKYFSGPESTPFLGLHGLGGIGKTQVAIEFAIRWKQNNENESVFWLHANSVNNLNASFEAIREKLGFPESAETNARTVVENWLRNPKNGRWVLIVDNVDDENVLNESDDEEYFKMLSCIPNVDHGHVLFTTRYKRVALKLADDIVFLDQMPKHEAHELLKKCLREQYDEKQTSDADELLEELSYIPLAIVHAGAYIRWSDDDIASYLAAYQESEDSKVEILEKKMKDLDVYMSDKSHTVLKTSWLSFKRLKADEEAGSLATELLSLMSFLDRQEIPRSLLRNFRPKAGNLKFKNALDTLKVYSLITENRSSNTCSMHRLVQLSMRQWLAQAKNGNQVEKYSEDSLKLLSDNFPDGSFPTWDQCRALIVHADTVLGHTVDSENRSARAKLLQNCANFQDGRGLYMDAQVKFEEVVKLRTELVGADNTETLRAMDQLSWTLRNQAKKGEALVLARRTLAKKEKLFGKTSAEALTTAHIVGTITGDQGNHQDATKIHQENLTARTELLGSEHPDTLRAASALSLELWELGRFVEAEALARQTLASRTELLGEVHPDTLEIKGTLGFILEIQGKYVEALEVKEAMLEVRDRIYGEDHPDTADSCHDMGWIHHQMGAYNKAEPYYSRALKAKERLLGVSHPKTLTTMCNLPVFYCDKGEYEEAEKRSKSLIAVFKRVQGDQHPQTLDATGGLAVILRHLGKLEEAVTAARTSIDGRNIVLGPGHPWTLPPLSHWGYILTLQGNTKQGEEVIRAALADLEKAMGPEASNVLTSLVFLSKNLLLQATGPEDPKLEESEQLAKRALDSRKKLLGKILQDEEGVETYHPYTYKTMHHFSRVVMARGRYEEAVELCKQALGGLRETLDFRHPDVLKCERNLREMEAKIEEAGKGENEEREEVLEVEIV